MSLISSSKIRLEKMRVDQVVYRFLSSVDPEGSVPCPKEPEYFNTHLRTLLFNIHFNILPSKPESFALYFVVFS
jgi:hypothetical protein